MEELEAPTGIEPVYTDLQSAASPLRHRANLLLLFIYSERLKWCKTVLSDAIDTYLFAGCSSSLEILFHHCAGVPVHEGLGTEGQR